MRFFFCTHVRLYDLPTRRPTLWGRPPRWQLWARDFYRVIVDEGAARVNYRAIEIGPPPLAIFSMSIKQLDYELEISIAW